MSTILDQVLPKGIVPATGVDPDLVPATNTSESGHIKCIVHGCQNHQDQGRFVNDLCGPCYSALVSGELGPGGNFLWALSEVIKDHLLRCKSCMGKGHYLDGDSREFKPCPQCEKLRRAWTQTRAKAYL